MKRSTREWVRKAEADYRGAIKLSRGNDAMHDLVCFHCQQCAEKYLKALIDHRGLSIPRTHLLVELLRQLLAYYYSLRSLRRGLDFLTRFAVGFRYPGENATKREATSALRWAERVRSVVRLLLGIRPRRKRRKKSP